MMMSNSASVLLRTIAVAGAAAVLLFTPAPAEAACPAGYYQCIKGGKAHSPRRCCPVAAPVSKPAPKQSGRCLSAVRQPGPGGSVKIKCVRWGSLPALTALRG
jgi:hypothetical protein